MYTQDVWETKKGDTSWLQDSKVFSSKDCACQNTFSWRRERQKKIGNEFAVKLDSLRQREFAKKRGPYNNPIWIGTKHSVHKCCNHARLGGYHCHGIAIAFVHNLQFFSDLRVVAKETFFYQSGLGLNSTTAKASVVEHWNALSIRAAWSWDDSKLYLLSDHYYLP